MSSPREATADSIRGEASEEEIAATEEAMEEASEDATKAAATAEPTATDLPEVKLNASIAEASDTSPRTAPNVNLSLFSQREQLEERRRQGSPSL